MLYRSYSASSMLIVFLFTRDIITSDKFGLLNQNAWLELLETADRPKNLVISQKVIYLDITGAAQLQDIRFGYGAMDFKALMAAKIANSKKPQATANVTASKYVRRSEQEAQREAAYAAEQARVEKERVQKLEKKRKLEEEEIEQNAIREEKKRKLGEESKARREAEEAEQERLRRKRLGLPELPPEPEDSKESTPLPEGQPDLLDDDLCIKLRLLNEPAVLYGESHIARLKRYYKLTTVSKSKRASGPIPTTLELVPEKDMLMPKDIPSKDTSEYTYLHRQLASYFTLLLSEWAYALSSRPDDVKQSQTGKAAEQTYLSVLRDLAPFYRKLEAKSMTSDLLTPIVEIVRNAQNRRYVDANDGYLRLSIGKAAWPIGVTMVGIHERSAREKIHEGDKQAHIMSDEATRKILQSIKRCLSFAQTRWPPEDIGQLMG